VTDAKTQEALDAIREALAGRVEGVVAAQMFQADGTWTKQTQADGGFFDRLLGRKPPPGEPRKFNLLALTSSRLHLIAAKPRSGRWVPGDAIGDWALRDLVITARSQHESWRDRHHTGANGMLSTAETIKLGIEIVPEERTLRLEGTVWEGDKLTEETVDAILAATGSPSLAELEELEPGGPGEDHVAS
jgi:hypothetical protein